MSPLGIENNNKLSLEKHVSNTCNKSEQTISSRIQSYKVKIEKEIITKTFVCSSFMCCLLTWHFCSKPSQIKIEKNQYRFLKLITDDYSDYKFLFIKTGNLTMEIKGLGTYALEIFKTLNNWDPILLFHERYM